jgi:hypothetical protein
LYKLLVDTKGRNYFVGLGIDGTIILRTILWKYGVRLSNVADCLRALIVILLVPVILPVVIFQRGTWYIGGTRDVRGKSSSCPKAIAIKSV